MKEQIAKLANECGFDVDKTGTFGNYSEMHRLEKFAELIVRECIAKSEEESERFYSLGHAELACAMQNYSLLLKEHFGVK